MSRAKRPSPPAAAAGVVRIIAGRWRGRRLPVPDVPGLRPTPDRVRETLFNWLMPMIEGSRCLDLFAGSGALGLEAASRGAAQVWLAERDPAALAALRAHVSRLDAGAVVHVQPGDALAWLRREPVMRFDLVFVDPPYDDDLAAMAIALLRENGWLSENAWLYAEWPAEQPPPMSQSPWRSGRAGRVAHALYRFPNRPG